MKSAGNAPIVPAAADMMTSGSMSELKTRTCNVDEQDRDRHRDEQAAEGAVHLLGYADR